LDGEEWKPNYVCVFRLSPESDLTKVLVKAVRELAEPEGSSIRAVEKFVQTVYEIEVEQVKGNHI
jgi:hypothetical protein